MPVACSVLSRWRGKLNPDELCQDMFPGLRLVFLPHQCSLFQGCWSTCSRSRLRLLGTTAASLVEQDILNAFHSNSLQLMPFQELLSVFSYLCNCITSQ